MAQVQNCIDAGTEYCPCYLAETGDCLMCSQLQGKTFCDCRDWQGVCIYREYVANRSRMKEKRESRICRILEKEEISAEVTILKIQVSRTLAREMNQPGAYVFLRNPQADQYFDAPMSVLAVDEREAAIEIAVQIKGAKTKVLNERSVLSDGSAGVLLRGPYWNGVLGLRLIKGLRLERALLLTRGIGQAPAVAVAKKLIQGGNKVTVFVDPGRSGLDLSERYFRKLGCATEEISPLFDTKNLTLAEEAREYLKRRIKEEGYRLLFSSGPDKMHEGIGRLLLAEAPDVSLACSNGARLCCGEGICGSCQTRTSDGTRVKSCKSQLEPIEIFAGR